MGLKYNVFMVKGTADDLYKKLTEAYPKKLIDTSDLMRRERDWYMRPVKTKEDIMKEPEPDLAEYIKNDNKMSIWFMDHPSQEGFIVGGYTSHWMREAEFTALFATLLAKAGVSEMVRVMFHHGSNDGDIYKLHMEQEKFDVETYSHKKGESERWEKYAKRIDKISGYPIVAWHDYISDWAIHFVPWKYTLDIGKGGEKHGSG